MAVRVARVIIHHQHPGPTLDQHPGRMAARVARVARVIIHRQHPGRMAARVARVMAVMAAARVAKAAKVRVRNAITGMTVRS